MLHLNNLLQKLNPSVDFQWTILYTRHVVYFMIVSTSQGQTPLTIAAENGNTDLVQFFIDSGIDIHSKDTAMVRHPLIVVGIMDELSSLSVLLKSSKTSKEYDTCIYSREKSWHDWLKLKSTSVPWLMMDCVTIVQLSSCLIFDNNSGFASIRKKNEFLDKLSKLSIMYWKFSFRSNICLHLWHRTKFTY